MSQSATTNTSAGRSLAGVVGIVAKEQTYKNLLYLFLALPLGILYYIILVTGFALGIGLSTVVIGLGILLVMLVGVRALGAFERRPANRLLGVDIDAPGDIEPDDNGLLAIGKAYVSAASTWRQTGFLFLKFFIGVFSFVLLALFVGIAVDLVLSPVFPEGALSVQINEWTVAESVETTAQQALAVPAGIVLGIVGLHVLNVFARVNASIALSLLGAENSESTQPAE